MATIATGEARVTSIAFDLASTVGKKVVRLPTAQRRQVQQPQNKAGREARRNLRAKQPNPFNYLFPSIREAKRKIDELLAMPPSPAVNLVRSMFDAANAEESGRPMASIKLGIAAGDPFALDVEALLKKVAGTTFGEQNDFAWVRSRMAEGVVL